QSHLCADQPPEILREWLVKTNAVDAVDDEASDDTDADGKKRHHDANSNVPGNNRRPGLPHEVEHGRHILESAYAVRPGAPGTRGRAGWPFAGVNSGFRAIHG